MTEPYAIDSHAKTCASGMEPVAASVAVKPNTKYVVAQSSGVAMQ